MATPIVADPASAELRTNTKSDTPETAASMAPASRRFSVTVHAVLPPPVTGMTLYTQGIADALAEHVPVRRFNWSNGSTKVTPWYLATKTARALTTPWRLVLSPRAEHAVFYMPANSGWAIFFNILAMSAARLRGYRCVLHHHHFRYVENYDWRMQLLVRALGRQGLHAVLCPEMGEGFRRQYGAQISLAFLPSTIQFLRSSFAPATVSEPDLSSGSFCIGHLSNLCLAKGLDLVIEVFRALRAEERNVRLILAGPVHQTLERRMIAEAQTEFGDRLEYRGPVYGAEKERFYREIHVNIYPTRSDAMPLVVTESFAFGKPVVSFERGCICSMMGPAAAWALPPRDSFADRAAHQVSSWIDNSSEYSAACRLARERYDAMLVDARGALGQFIQWVLCEPGNGFVLAASNTN